jgi:hypothetical protein
VIPRVRSCPGRSVRAAVALMGWRGLPGRFGGLRRAARPRRPRGAGQRLYPRPGHPADAGADPLRARPRRPGAATSRPSRRADPGRAAQRAAGRTRLPRARLRRHHPGGRRHHRRAAPPDHRTSLLFEALSGPQVGPRLVAQPGPEGRQVGPELFPAVGPELTREAMEATMPQSASSAVSAAAGPGQLARPRLPCPL